MGKFTISWSYPFKSLSLSRRHQYWTGDRLSTAQEYINRLIHHKTKQNRRESAPNALFLYTFIAGRVHCVHCRAAGVRGGGEGGVRGALVPGQNAHRQSVQVLAEVRLSPRCLPDCQHNSRLSPLTTAFPTSSLHRTKCRALFKKGILHFCLESIVLKSFLM